ncbi:MAG: hypothetical protein ABUT20_33705 [Bacteroidota bacterium]
MNQKVFVLLVTSFLLLKAVAQKGFLKPDARGRAHLIYHPNSKAMLLIDGYAVHADSTNNNVWKWDGKKWEAIIADGPGSRCGNAAALNKNTGNILTFGGWGKGGFATDARNDVWLFDGKQWKNVFTNFIEKHDHHKMVYADHLNAFVIYGGRNSTTGIPDSITWILKDGFFEALAIPGPGRRGNAGFAYDPLRKKIVLFGGKGYDVPADLWEFDGKKWEQVPVENIGMTTGQEMVYSEELKMTIVHGNTGTWGWDGKTMTKIASGGPAGSNVALGYDPARKSILAYGGFEENNTISSSLWELKNGKWKKVSENGIWKQVSKNKYERINGSDKNRKNNNLNN